MHRRRGILGLLHILNSKPVYQSVFRLYLIKIKIMLPSLFESSDLTSLLGIYSSRGDSIKMKCYTQ